MCNGDIFKGNIEFLCTLKEISSNAVADSFTLRDELSGIKLGYDRLKDFVANGWKNTFIVILSKTLCIEIRWVSLVFLWQSYLVNLW